MRYEVTIEARITKTYEVEAEDPDHAYELAHDKFDVFPDINKREYIEYETMNIKLID
jgi:hypothetical protein